MEMSLVETMQMLTGCFIYVDLLHLRRLRDAWTSSQRRTGQGSLRAATEGNRTA